MMFSIILPAYRERGVCNLVEKLLSERPAKSMRLEKIIVVEC